MGTIFGVLIVVVAIVLVIVAQNFSERNGIDTGSSRFLNMLVLIGALIGLYLVLTAR